MNAVPQRGTTARIVRTRATGRRGPPSISDLTSLTPGQHRRESPRLPNVVWCSVCRSAASVFCSLQGHEYNLAFVPNMQDRGLWARPGPKPYGVHRRATGVGAARDIARNPFCATVALPRGSTKPANARDFAATIPNDYLSSSASPGRASRRNSWLAGTERRGLGRCCCSDRCPRLADIDPDGSPLRSRIVANDYSVGYRQGARITLTLIVHAKE
jgi:hypothetical protein